MDWWIWIAPGPSVLGAGLAYLGARAGVRQRERAAQREELQQRRAEWRQRFEMALGQLSQRDDSGLRSMGRIILESLANSDLATTEDRELAERLLEREMLDGHARERLDDAVDNLREPTDNEDSAGRKGAP